VNTAHLILAAALFPALTASAFAGSGIFCPAGAPANVKLAAQEVRRYVFLRTGELLPVLHEPPDRPDGIRLAVDAALEPQQYRLKSAAASLTISGGSEIGVLYGAYAFAEKLGVRFYLHGDVIPDEKIPFVIPPLDETRQPLFALRGVNPWGSHSFGFDAWNADDYKAVITQLAKMRMNFIGMHCYPEGHPYAEPTVWHGLDGDFDAAGKVKASYVSRYFNTLLTPAWGGFLPTRTGDYSFGAAQLFARDDWAPAALEGYCPMPQTADACNDVFNRVGTQFKDAFTFARQMGVKTCLGTEAPLVLPKSVAQRSTDVRAVYEATFRRIMAAHPLDYYWIWTPEDWTWQGNKPEQYSNTIADIQLAIKAHNTTKAPFQLATAGWVLGPQHDRSAFDRDLPKHIPMSAISRETGATEVDPAFARIADREKWAIPWLESDNRQGLAALQLEAGRMRRDAAAARAYGCTGLMGLHWRTDILAPNASALAQAAWDQSWRAPQADAPKPRSLPCDDFYADWAQVNFGTPDAGKVFAAIDGKVPQVTDGGCPSGSLTPVNTPWSSIAPQFAFVDEFEQLRPRIRGTGNLDRFDYWLSTFKYVRSLAQLRCALAKPDAAELARLYADAYRHLLATVNTPGGLAMVVNLENHPGWGPAIANHAIQPWPKDYQGTPRLIVPTLRSVVTRGETLALKIIALDKQAVKSVAVRLRPMGKGEWQTIPATHIARAVYEAKLPAASEDFEYHITADTAGGGHRVWPATAPQLSQTVVVRDETL
jgi:hypothetical protein